MKPTYTDPRITRTRKGLREAVGQLLQEKSFDALTLNEIAEVSSFNRATIYKHYPDKFALLDDWVMDEFQRRLVEATTNVQWSGRAKLKAVLSATCEAIRWIQSLGRTDDRLLRPIAESRMRNLLLQILHYGAEQELVIQVGNADLALNMASAAIYAASEARVAQHHSLTDMDAFVSEIMNRLAGVLTVNESPPPKGDSDFNF